MSFMAENWHISSDDKDLLSLPLTLPFIIAQMAKLILDKRSSLVYFDISETWEVALTEEQEENTCEKFRRNFLLKVSVKIKKKLFYASDDF